MNPGLEPADDELFGFVLGELPEERRAALELWSRSTPQNQARVAELRALVSSLERAPPPADLAAAVDARIEQHLRRRRGQRAGGAVLMLAAMACLLAWWQLNEGDDVRIKGTGAATSWAGVQVYRLEAAATPQPLADKLGSHDSLLFAYTNGGHEPFTHLLVFGVASTGQVFWYHPAWERAEDDPQALALEPSQRPIELHEKITHDLPRGRFVVHAVFARRALRVSEVERAAAHAAPLSPLDLPETMQQRFVVEVF